LRGVSINDCVRVGTETAEGILADGNAETPRNQSIVAAGRGGAKVGAS